MIKSSRKDGEWVEVRGNLDLSWYTGKIKPPDNLEIHGDLNYTGCINIQGSFLKSLIVHGNMFMCNVREFENLPVNECRVKGNLFACNTKFANNNKIHNDKRKTEKWTSSEVEKIWRDQTNFDKLKKKLPELEGLL